ncbi:YtpR family tRNA-binding protein [Sporosarcina koreensis]|uniref:YtpR family tRNA-binding protein n=1 Tax=Sporosarcina koreensis TaxID=334735 RepID=A0ABW0U2L3_9BACL
MNIFYNQNGVGDVLLVQLTTERPENREIESNKDITLIIDEATKKIVAFNVFNASTYVKVEADGQVETTEEIVGQLQEALKSNGIELELDVDLTPKFVVGHVITKEKHPNADKLSVCTVDVGNETLQIVCGAPNVDAGQKVVVAKVGAVMPSGMVIRDAELRGIASSGMICSAKELGIPNAPVEKGIMVLSEDATPGEPFTM